MKPQKAISKYPAFQPNQVLTADALNSAVGYLLQQELHTRNKLIGIGIVCGMTLEKVNSPLGLIIHDGCGISSMGALGLHIQPRDINNSAVIVPYTHARQFKTNDNKFIIGEDDNEFKGLANLGNDAQKAQIRELVTTSEFTANQGTKGGAALTAADLADNVVILYFDDFLAKTGGCLNENCDEKGMVHELALKPLLVPKAVMDAYLADGATQKSADRLRYAEFQNDKYNLNYIRANQLSFNEAGRVQLKNVKTVADLQLLFEDAIKGKSATDTSLTQIGQAIYKLRNEFLWLFDNQLRLPVSSYFSDATGNIFANNILNAIAAGANRAQIQYAYDFVRDVVEAHNDLYEKICDLLAICCPDEWMFPTHLMLGLVESPAAIKQFDATKITNPTSKYRHGFSPAFTDMLQRDLREEIYFKIERLNILLNSFDLNAIKNKVSPRILPSFDYDKHLSDRVIPAYYSNPVMSGLKLYWNFENTQRNKSSRSLFYDMFANDTEPFRFDWVRNDFFRIEGHIGKPFAATNALIDSIRKNNNLPFELKTVALNAGSNSSDCAMPDLQEEYDFQRRRLLAILKRFIKKLGELKQENEENIDNLAPDDKLREQKLKSFGLLKKLLDELTKLLNKIIELLKEPCVSNFNYIDVKKIYEQIWFLIIDYAYKQDEITTQDKAESKEAVNMAITAANLFLFAPLYKIYIALQHRKALMQGNSVDSLEQLATKFSGLEHLAGVRRGQTFVVVHDGTNIVADFNLPYHVPCECGCIEETCANKKMSFANPVATPMILFVNIPEIRKSGKTYHSISFFEEDLLMGDDKIKDFRFDKSDPKLASVTNKLLVKKTDTEFEIAYVPDFDKDPNGWYQIKYIIETQTGQVAEGILFLGIVGGRAAFDVKNLVITATIGQTAFTPVTPLTKAQFTAPPVMEFKSGGKISKQTIGGVANVWVLETSAGHALMISRDAQNYPQFQVLKLNQKPSVEDFAFEVTYNGQTIAATGTLNVTPVTAGPPSSGFFKGVLVDNAGVPIAKARVFNTVKNIEVFTNDKGEYEIPSDKAGELLLVQKDGFDELKVQVGTESKLTLNKNLAKTGLLDNISNKNLINIIGAKNLRIK